MKIQNPPSLPLPFVHPAPIGLPLVLGEVFFMAKGYVYFFRHIGTTPVKIGMTSNETVQSRFNSFKTYAPYGAEILGFIETDKPSELESLFHNQLKDKRLSGEFFEISTDIVNSLIIKYGNKKINKLKQDFELWLSGIDENNLDLDIFKRLVLKKDKYFSYVDEKELLQNVFQKSDNLMSFDEILFHLKLNNAVDISKRKIGVELKKLGFDSKLYKKNGKVFKAYNLEIIPCNYDHINRKY